jgi:hypothetical protein
MLQSPPSSRLLSSLFIIAGSLSAASAWVPSPLSCAPLLSRPGSTLPAARSHPVPLRMAVGDSEVRRPSPPSFPRSHGSLFPLDALVAPHQFVGATLTEWFTSFTSSSPSPPPSSSFLISGLKPCASFPCALIYIYTLECINVRMQVYLHSFPVRHDAIPYLIGFPTCTEQGRARVRLAGGRPKAAHGEAPGNCL